MAKSCSRRPSDSPPTTRVECIVRRPITSRLDGPGENIVSSALRRTRVGATRYIGNTGAPPNCGCSKSCSKKPKSKTVILSTEKVTSGSCGYFAFTSSRTQPMRLFSSNTRVETDRLRENQPNPSVVHVFYPRDFKILNFRETVVRVRRSLFYGVATI